MWIQKKDGNLVNVAYAGEILIERREMPNPRWEVIAMPGRQYLASFDDEAEAKATLGTIVSGLKLGSLFIEI